jgi:hypothetical protein
VLSLSGTARIFLCRAPVDFRKAHDGLLAVVRDMLDEDIFAGAVFVFPSAVTQNRPVMVT